jgi:predicted membrane protein
MIFSTTSFLVFVRKYQLRRYQERERGIFLSKIKTKLVTTRETLGKLSFLLIVSSRQLWYFPISRYQAVHREVPNISSTMDLGWGLGLSLIIMVLVVKSSKSLKFYLKFSCYYGLIIVSSTLMIPYFLLNPLNVDNLL